MKSVCRKGKYVMWFHLELKGEGYKAARIVVAVNNRITGPYRYVNSFRPIRKNNTYYLITSGCTQMLRHCIPPHSPSGRGRRLEILYTEEVRSLCFTGNRHLFSGFHHWLPVEWKEELPVIPWRDDWNPDFINNK
ncbi:hypothetical protein SAMN04488128_1011477 [Chitinophaga eiseniae]|uniref:Uncharacterized protein n=1 Tax=Chitinophaga eiseniae TaxID=634771 RepID=A0A1T4N962_9BACT|nr:hypothetical protein [Chitinophaga eiseniae]SJZ75388.1 hypothetical protein SAMN04488128_1011477 [Chitinophaga eiseniae]